MRHGIAAVGLSVCQWVSARRLTEDGPVQDTLTHRQDEKGGDSSGGDLEDVGTGMGLRNGPSGVKSGAYSAN